MSTRDARLNTIGEIKTAFMAGKEVTVWNYEPGDAVAKIQSANDWADAWLRIFKYDLSVHWFSAKEESPEYRAFKTVEEVEPFFGQVVTGPGPLQHTSCSGLLLGAYENRGFVHIKIGGRGYVLSDHLLDNFKFVKTGKPVGIEVK